MTEWIVPALLALNGLMLLWLLLRPDDKTRQAQADERQREQRARDEEHQRALRAELQDGARATRQELAASLALLQQTLLAHSGDIARTQNEQIDAFRSQLAVLQHAVGQSLQAVAAQLTEQFRVLTEANERRLGEVRQAVEGRLAALQEGNEKKLEQMRATVDEKLHATLEQRLGESFKQVAERLEQVHRGLGEMQALARDVGSLNRVLTNVKTRGIFGEVQLAGLLEQVFTPEQYAANVETVPGSGARVEFAIRLPGRHGAEGGPPVWLPIDAKFPREDYERLLDAQERADAPAVELAARAIEARLKLEARTIREKYLAAPHTTDFAILFVPTESLYAEALRRPGLVEHLQREHRIMLAGPTTLLATLSSLQMGFRTLALERRSAEVWQVLGAVKTEFAKFGEVLARTRKKLQEAGNTIEAAEVRTRAMARQLRGVEAVGDAYAQQALPGIPEEGEEIEGGASA
ncbi:DNA recombination protein RmuC [Aquincola sp. S2]|uniref:DNA recombination protein RmuC n=1 Tax=Pseudaquabacterium terrae TaxID=2732868 RepID=A0ABX2EJY7_9BURK|nr:DNA recombination protein RmuC [Aquabacterium terrae]NRF68961.1 DNA recombination protein RmuC [Aquabacterium terrae]